MSLSCDVGYVVSPVLHEILVLSIVLVIANGTLSGALTAADTTGVPLSVDPLVSDETPADPTGVPPSVDPLVSDETLIIFNWLCYSTLGQLVAIFGTITNIINITCFVKMGFKDPVNVSFLGLAVSDLCCAAFLLWTNICMNPAFSKADLPFEPIGVQYLTTGWPHVIFSRVTSWITVFITLERCLCITAPLKVKGMFTSKKVTIIIVCLYVFLLTSSAPVYIANRLGMVFFPTRNKSVVALVHTEDTSSIQQASFAFNNVFIPFTAFVVIVICTAVLVISLRRQTIWRQQSTTTSQSDKVSSRDQRVVKMVVVISTLFIACFVPVAISFIAMVMLPELSIDGRLKNTNTVFIGLGLLLECTNSGGNIFIYYFMSSKYKQVFCELLVIKTQMLHL